MSAPLSADDDDDDDDDDSFVIQEETEEDEFDRCISTPVADHVDQQPAAPAASLNVSIATQLRSPLCAPALLLLDLPRGIVSYDIGGGGLQSVALTTSHPAAAACRPVPWPSIAIHTHTRVLQAPTPDAHIRHQSLCVCSSASLSPPPPPLPLPLAHLD